FFFFQAEDGIRDRNVTGVQTCALPIYPRRGAVGGACLARCRGCLARSRSNPVLGKIAACGSFRLRWNCWGGGFSRGPSRLFVRFHPSTYRPRTLAFAAS